jgi:hypothetical protein
MKDRNPTQILPNGAIRYAVYDASGNFLRYDYMLPADNPSEEGTALNKANLFRDTTALSLGLPLTAVPDDGFNALIDNWGRIDYTIETADFITDSVLGELPGVQQAMGAAADGAGNAILAGGRGTSSTGFSSVIKFTPSGVRTTLTALPYNASDVQGITGSDGDAWFFGGNNQTGVTKYSVTGTRTIMTSMAIARRANEGRRIAALDGNGNIILAGGASQTNVVEMYSPAGAKTTLTPMLYARSDSTISPDGSGNVVIIGSENQIIERYAAGGAKLANGSLPNRLESATSCNFGSQGVLVLGGRVQSTGVNNTAIYRINPNGSVTTVGTLALGAINYYSPWQAIEINGSVCLLNGGLNAPMWLINKNMEIYDMGQNAAASPLSYSGVCPIGRASFIVAGGSYSNTVTGRVFKCDVVKQLHAVEGVRYKFTEDNSEKVLKSSPLNVQVPDEGYIRMGGKVTM